MESMLGILGWRISLYKELDDSSELAILLLYDYDVDCTAEGSRVD